MTEPRRPGNRRRLPRVRGTLAAAWAAVGVGMCAGGVAISVASASGLANWLGFALFFLGIWAIAVPTTFWLMTRYGVSDSIERSRDWIDCAPRSNVRRPRS